MGKPPSFGFVVRMCWQSNAFAAEIVITCSIDYLIRTWDVPRPRLHGVSERWELGRMSAYVFVAVDRSSIKPILCCEASNR